MRSGWHVIFLWSAAQLGYRRVLVCAAACGGMAMGELSWIWVTASDLGAVIGFGSQSTHSVAVTNSEATRTRTDPW